jgi:ceramide glucosyltransferase
VAAKHVIKTDFVVAKSMALRRSDLRSFGGFEAIKDVLAEDYVTGRLVIEKLRKRVALASTPIQNVCCFRSVGDFVQRYARWSVMQRRVAGPFLYCAMLILNPVLLSSGALLLLRERWALVAWAMCVALKAFAEGLARIRHVARSVRVAFCARRPA